MKTLVCLVLILAWPIEYAPPDAEPGVTVVRGDRPLNTEGPRLPVTEPHLAVDPKDASHLVAAAIVIKKSDLSVADCAAFVSFDGGSSWKRHDFSLVECADPWVAVGEDGTVLLTVLGRAAGEDVRGDPRADHRPSGEPGERERSANKATPIAHEGRERRESDDDPVEPRHTDLFSARLHCPPPAGA